MSTSIPPTALVHIREAEQAARNGIERTKLEIQAVDADIQSVKRKAARCLENLKEQDEALVESTVNLARAIDECNEQHDSLVEKKERLEGEKEQYGFQASFLFSQGKLCWNKLTNDNKWNKGILLALIYSDRHSRDMGIEKLWVDGLVPASLVDDKDLLLARLSHEAFACAYVSLGRGTAVFHIPKLLLSHEVVAAAVFRYPEILIQDVISEQFFDDEAIFANYIVSPRWEKNLFGYAAGCDKKTLRRLLSKFSARIRGSSTLMLEVVKITSFVFRCLEGELIDDEDFALQLAESMEPGYHARHSDYMYERELPNDALKYFSVSVRSNPKVVRAFISKNGLCLRHATLELRGLEDIIRTACAQCASAFFYCAPGPTKSRLLADKDFMLSVLPKVEPFSSRESFSRKYFGIVEEYTFSYKMLPLVLQHDRDIICAAKESESISMPTDLPDSLADDPTFWQEMIRNDASYWHVLPRKFEDDDAFARAIENFEEVETVKVVFERFPALVDDPAIWSSIIGSGGDYDNDLDEAVGDCAPPGIRRDRELMLHALSRNGHVFTHLPSDLQEDRVFAEILVERCVYALKVMPHRVQRLYPDLVVASMRESKEYHIAMTDFVEYVAPECWFNRNVCKKYIQHGGLTFEHFPEEIKTDQSIGLFAAEFLDEYDFEECVSATLRSNKSFMMQAIRLNSRHFLCADGVLRHDDDLALLAISCEANGQYLAKHLTGDFHDTANVALLRPLWNEAKEKISAHQAFCAGILCGMSLFAGEGCPLKMLTQDPETTASLQDTFASLMGVPLGTELGMLRRVVKNLNTCFAQEELFWDDSA